jgi:hypothetical protein
MLAFPDVIELFPHEFASLRASGFTLAGIFFRAINDLLLGHINLPMLNESSVMLEKLTRRACAAALRVLILPTLRGRAGSRFLFLILSFDPNVARGRLSETLLRPGNQINAARQQDYACDGWYGHCMMFRSRSMKRPNINHFLLRRERKRPPAKPDDPQDDENQTKSFVHGRLRPGRST